MSRIGRLPIAIPQGVDVKLDGRTLKVKGPKGELTQTFHPDVTVKREDGTLTALIHTGVAAMTTHNNCPEQFTFPARHLYAAETFRLAQQVADMDMVANTWMRAPGESVGTFALECALDELRRPRPHARDHDCSARSSNAAGKRRHSSRSSMRPADASTTAPVIAST